MNRDVALKVLPTSFAGDADRLARFAREAHVLAALNHPHIAAIYGLEEQGDLRALVLELVEGETLSTRIARGPIPVSEALEIAKQIASVRLLGLQAWRRVPSLPMTYAPTASASYSPCLRTTRVTPRSGPL